jgi:acetyl-CoA synthetase
MASAADAAAVMALRVNMNARARLIDAGFIESDDGSWQIPRRSGANIAADTVGRHAAGSKAEHLALVHEDADGTVRSWTFRALDKFARRMASSLARSGVAPGQPVGVHLGQGPETAIAHLACYYCGAIVCTMSELYGPDTLSHILRDTGLRTLITRRRAGALATALDQAADPVRLVTTDDESGENFWLLLESGDEAFTALEPASDSPALLMYTSGSTGRPKGMLHAHRVLDAYLPTVRLFYNLSMDEPGAVFWSPADWAWVGGLLDLVLPAWAHGQTVLSWSGRFEPPAALALMARHRVTHTFMTPTALKRLAEVTEPRKELDLRLRYVCSGGESLPGEVVRWCEQQLGAVCNEFYGLTEFNHLVGNCRAIYPVRPGSMGRAYPGHDVRLVDDVGQEVPRGEVGEIVASPGDPTLFLGYWGQPGIPESLRLGAFIRTRDLARMDDDGYIWYQGRNDDLIKSAGYRIGPAEVEDTLLKHPSVAEAAVIASPDPERGAIVKAFVRLKEGTVPSEELVRVLQQLVKTDLAAYKYPRAVEFVDSFPLTSSGKIRRSELRRLEYEAKGLKA